MTKRRSRRAKFSKAKISYSKVPPPPKRHGDALTRGARRYMARLAK